MTHPEDNKGMFAALREAPAEVGLHQVENMVAAFPMAIGAMAWLIHTLKFNLNSLLMTSTATLLVGTSAYLIGTSAPAEAPAADITVPAVVLEMPAAEALPEPGPAVVFERPTEKKSSPTQPQQQPEIACTVAPAAEVSANTAPTPEPVDHEPLASSTAIPPVAPLRTQAPMADATSGERSFALRDFSGIRVENMMNVTLEIGDFEVIATGAPEVLEQLDVNVKEQVLQLDLIRDGRRKKKCGPVHFMVRMPVVHLLAVMGSGSIIGQELPTTTHLDLNVMGAGNITLTRLQDASVLNMVVKGSGSIQLDEVAQAERTQLNVLGSGVAEVQRMKNTASLDIVVAGSGVATCKAVNVSGTTTMNLTGTGQVIVGGRTDRIDVALVGSGDVQARDLRSQGGKVAVTGSGAASVHSDGPLELLRSGSGTIHTSGSAGHKGSRGVGAATE